MSKAILISIKPKWVARILNGEKTIEIRKTRPNCDLPIPVYIYCTKEKTRAILTDKGCVISNTLAVGGNSQYKSGYSLSGQVVAKFTLNKVEEIVRYDGEFYTPTYEENKICLNACLSWEEIHRYLANKKTGYAWHIENLKIFNEPKELNDFMVKPTKRFFMEHIEQTYCILGKGIFRDLTKAPQSWCYVEVEE